MVEVYSPWLASRSTHAKRQPPLTTGLSIAELRGFTLPMHYVMDEAAKIVREQHRVAHEQLEEHRGQNDGVALVTASDLKARRIDRTARGKFALMPKDERKRRYQETPVYIDTTPGEAPMFVVGGPGEHWQSLKEQVDESRHYGLDRQELSDRPDVHGAYVRAAEKAEIRRKGATSGYARLDKDGRPDFSNG